MKIIILSSLVLFQAGCATDLKSVGLGAGIGAGAGALVGSIADPGRHGEHRTRNIILGTTVGAMAGSVAGSVVHKNQEDKKKEAFLKGQASRPQMDGSPPALSAPRVETKWIEGRAQGNRYIEGHFEYVILEPARWEAQ